MRTDEQPRPRRQRSGATTGKRLVAQVLLLICPLLFLSLDTTAHRALLPVAFAATTNGADVAGKCNADGGDDESCIASLDGASGKGDEEDEEEEYNCVDGEKRCAGWANMGECTSNPGYMLKTCPVSCDSCPKAYRMSPEEAALLKVVAGYGVKQKVEGEDTPKVMEVLRKTVDYMRDTIPTLGLTPEVLGECTNKDALCAFWAVTGECEENPGYMKVKCAPSCQSCHLIDFDSRCPPLSEDVRPGLLPGELNAMFERIVATAPGNRTDDAAGEMDKVEGMPDYTVVVHSRPEPLIENGGDEQPAADVSKERDLEQPPWIVTFENFITDEECDRLVEVGHEINYERSKDVGAKLADGSYDALESHSRTSENAWCSYRNKCREDPVAVRVHERMAMVTGIPSTNSEDLQLLKYKEGQFYRPHHDYIEHQQHRRCGPRVLTFFLYLSDVDEGGATNFTDLDIAVKPKKGRALLWPSVLNSDPKQKDPRTHHEACDVKKGLKFGANAWIHLHSYLDAQDMGCA